MSPLKKLKTKRFMTLVITLLMIGLGLTVLDLVKIEPISASGENWADYSFLYRTLITIDSTMFGTSFSYSNFPVEVNITNNATMYGNVRSDGYDFSFFSYVDNVTEFNYEREYFSVAGNVVNAVFWVNISEVLTNVDYSFWMYYGDDNAGDIYQDSSGTWDSKYRAVFHMNDNTTSIISDSTGNDFDGNKNASNTPVESDGMIGKCQSFSNSTGSFVNLSKDWVFSENTTYAISCWYKTDWIPVAVSTRMLYTNTQDSDVTISTVENVFEESLIKHMHRTNVGGYQVISQSTNTTSWHFDVLAKTASDTWYTYVDNTRDDTPNGGTGKIFQDFRPFFHIGGTITSAGTKIYLYDGKIDELRLEQGPWRGYSYYYATYNMTSNPSNYISFGGEEESGATVGDITLLLPDDMFTWQEELGNTSWANESGSVHEWAEFNFTYDTQAFHYLRVNISDISSNNNLTADMIDIKFSSDNITWGNEQNTYNLTDDDSIIINETIWDAYNGWWCHGDNPFPIDNTKSIFMIMRLNIPLGIGNETYSCNNWSWDAGYYS